MPQRWGKNAARMVTSEHSEGDARDVVRGERDDAAEQRDVVGDERDLVGGGRDAAAHERDEVAERRDAAADQRDAVGDDRDAAADARDAAADERDRRWFAGGRSGSDAEDLSAAGRRGDAAAADRVDSARDRHAAAAERAESERDRHTSFVDRGAGSTERAESERDRSASLNDRTAGAGERQKASLDALTGAYLRGPGLLELRREMARALRIGKGLTIAFVDVDRLKVVNDSRGHAAGDELLAKVVRAIRSKMRSYDLIVRYGGDEFVCVFSGLHIAEVAARFEFVHSALADDVEHPSVTVGLAALLPQDSVETLLSRADEMLYRHKQLRETVFPT